MEEVKVTHFCTWKNEIGLMDDVKGGVFNTQNEGYPYIKQPDFLRKPAKIARIKGGKYQQFNVTTTL